MKTKTVVSTESWECIPKAPEPDCPRCKGKGYTMAGDLELSCVCTIGGFKRIPNKPITLTIPEEHEQN